MGGDLGCVYLQAEAQAWREAGASVSEGEGWGTASGAGTRAGTGEEGLGLGQRGERNCPGQGWAALRNRSASEGGARDLGGMERPGTGEGGGALRDVTAGRGAGLTIQALHCQHVVPAEQRVAAQPLVVGRHERARRRRVRQAERVADLVRQHHEQVAPAAAAQRPALVAVEVRFAPTGQEGVRQGAPCRRRGGSGGATARHVRPRVPTLQRAAPGLGVVVFCGTVSLLMTSGGG